MRFSQIRAGLNRVRIRERLVLLCLLLWALFVLQFEPWQHQPTRRQYFASAAYVFWSVGEHVVDGARYYARSDFSDAKKYGLKVSETPPPLPSGFEVETVSPALLYATPEASFICSVLLPALLGALLLAGTIWLACWCLDPAVTAMRAVLARTQ